MATNQVTDRPLPWPEDIGARIGELIGDARIVAIGENNHHIAEFGELRLELIKTLVAEHGFTVVAFESGFAEGRSVDEWIRGGPGEVADICRDGFTFYFGDAAEVQDTMSWLREYNAAGGRVRYAGLDVASSGGSPEPSLRAVREYLAVADPAAVSIVDDALAATEPYSGVSNAVSPGMYAELDQAARDRATAALARVLAHLDTMAAALIGSTDAESYAIARHHAIGAVRIDTFQIEFAAMTSGTAAPLCGSSRDTHMAETVRLLRRLHGEDARILLLTHNGHLQRIPLPLLPTASIVTAGAHLAAEYGTDYVTVAVTAGSGTTTGLAVDPVGRLGFTVHEEPLGPPAEGTVEQRFAGQPGQLLDLRAERAAGRTGPRGIRHVTMTSDVPVAQAFDVLVYLPDMRVSGFVRAED